MLLGTALAQSPFPPGLNAAQRKLYRDALAEKAQPIYADARDSLNSADARARELGVTGTCPARTVALLEKLNVKPPPPRELALGPAPIFDTPEMMDERTVAGEQAKRLLIEALETAGKLDAGQSIARFQSAAEAEATPGAAHFDLAIALDRAGRAADAEKAWRTVARIKGAVGYDASARLAALAVERGDAGAARTALELAESAFPGPAVRVLHAELELALNDPAAAQTAARKALEASPGDPRALCAMARAQLALGNAGVAGLLAARAASADPDDAAPILVQMEIARAAHLPAAELAAARAAVEADPDSARAELALGRVLFERGQFRDADQALTQAATLAPRSAEPHLALARLRLDGDGDAQAALAEAKLFLTLCIRPPPPGHPIHALLQRCEEALKPKAQASVVQSQ